MKGFKIEFSLDSADNIFVLIEDDGRACYAYLCVGPRITSLVWLYNRLPAPEHFEEPRGVNGPRNPSNYVLDQAFAPPKDEFEVEALCRRKEDALDASVYIRGKLHALLKPGQMPGWCVLAKKDGPLALQLDLTDVTSQTDS